MELYVLKELAAFADLGTLSAVAGRLHVSQPALSRSMQKAEEEFGVAVFDHAKNRLALNETGRLAATYARRIADLHDEMIHAVQEFDRARRTLTFASVAPAPIKELTDVLVRLFPGQSLSPELNESESELLARLDSDELQFVVLAHPPKDKTHVSVPCMEERLSASLPKGHRLASRKSLRLTDLNGEKVLLFSKIGYWNIVRTIADKMKPLVQDHFETFGEIVEASNLPSFTTNVSLTWSDFNKNRVIVPFTDPEATATFHLVCRAADRDRFAAFFKEAALLYRRTCR